MSSASLNYAPFAKTPRFARGPKTACFSPFCNDSFGEPDLRQESRSPCAKEASGKDRHSFVAVTEPALAHPQRIPGRSHEKPVWPRGRAFEPVPVALVAAAYFGAAKVGLSLAFVAEQVTAVWPPTGIALAALLLFGSRAWPGIALGAAIVPEKRTGRRARRPAPRDPGAGAPPRLSRGGGRQGPKVPARNGGSAGGNACPSGRASRR